jgi:magnesium-transporting ATPase (P-type)
MTTIHAADSRFIAFVKGAPDILLTRAAAFWKTAKPGRSPPPTPPPPRPRPGKWRLRPSGSWPWLPNLDAIPAEIAADVIERDLTFVGLLA